MNSTEICFPEPSDRNGTWWPKAPIGQSVTLEQKVLCSIEPGLIPYRKCLGDRIYGGVWESVEKDSKQCLPPANPETKTLDAIHKNSSRMQIDEIEGALKGINDVIRNYTEKMEPMDIYFVSGAIENFRETLLNNGTNNAAVIGNKSTSYYCDLSDVLSHMMNVERTVMNGSQSLYNATNRLLDSTESIINQLSTAESVRADRNCLDDRRGNDSEEQGTMLLRKPRFVLLVADPDEANVTGMALIRTNTTEDHDFDSYDVRLLTMDDSEEDTLAIENLEIASFIPRTLLNKMKQLRPNNTNPDVPFRVVISVYFNDRFFQESLGENSRGTNGKIVSVTVPGYGSELPERLPVFVREVDSTRNSSCEFWKFLRNDGDDTSRWSPIGCESSGKWNNVNLCKCSHMTSFSRIFLDPFGAKALEKNHPNAERILDTITLVGCLLSLFGIMGIFITAIVFPRWNDLFNTKILLNLSFAVAIELIVFTFIGYFKRPDDDMWCAVQGASIHYTILVTFMWMLVIAHLQFMQFVKVLGKLRPTHCVLKATIVSWGLPLAPVGFFFFQNNDLYLPKKNYTSDICFPHDQAQFYGLLIPIALILTVNLACFLLIMYHVSRAPDNLTRSTNKNMALLQLRLLVLLFFQLGLSWMFGMMITENAHLVWSYLFCLTAPYQGLMLFVNFILLQPSTRRLWSKKIAEVVTQNYDRFALKKSTSSSQPPMWL
ncbi:conserved hypothetical protein [Culex quinquefasciatus]|uniref:G-protein coupled receptor n=1 Tax=Culex quinquefasciatus TaxID=7176 RepID=B0WWV0_CULQU|nr:conserved hypothetical protein [Culex quinquefasciatus]|eukprot:XP_001861872.1 conserved hypothetical protein [Culex quinquefasciatus]